MSGNARRQWIDRRAFVRGSLGVGGMVVLGSVAAACGDDSDQSGDPRQTSAPQPTGERQRGGSLRVGVGEIPTDYFAGQALFRVATFVQFAWPLYLASPTDPESMNALATNYDATPDGLTHTFSLRKGLKFHDGSALGAEEVAENLRGYFFEDHPLRDDGPYINTLAFREDGTFESAIVVDSVDVIDELTVQMVLTKPRIDVRQALRYMFILNPKILAQDGYGTDPEALRDAGSGPFRVTKFEPESFIEFERFDGFFDEAGLDQLRFQQITDPAALALSLRSGDIDVAIFIPQADYEDLAADPAFQGLVAPYPALNLFFQLSPFRQPEMVDPRVREAIWLAMNREQYVEAFFPPGTASLATQAVVVEGMDSWNPDLEHRPHDPERARELLADAGVENLTLTTISTPASSALSTMRQLWEAVRSDLAEAGIDLEITIVDEATYQDASTGAQEKDWDFLGMPTYEYEHEFLLFPLYFTRVGAVEAPDPRATNPDVKRLLRAAGETADPEEQAEIFRELMRLDHEELMMAIPLALVAKWGIARQEVRDLRIVNTADPLHHAWIDG